MGSERADDPPAVGKGAKGPLSLKPFRFNIFVEITAI